jgi:tetrahydromethanopterin S-methyltransferase subunit G
MSKQTIASAHERIDGIEPRIAKLEAELSTLQRSVQRVENILIGTAASVIGLLITVLMRMG